MNNIQLQSDILFESCKIRLSTCTSYWLCRILVNAQLPGNSCHSNSEVRHPCCVASITKNFCVLHIQSNTNIFHLVVQ